MPWSPDRQRAPLCRRMPACAWCRRYPRYLPQRHALSSGDPLPESITATTPHFGCPYPADRRGPFGHDAPVTGSRNAESDGSEHAPALTGHRRRWHLPWLALCLVDQGRQTDRRACSKGAANEAGHVDWRSLVSQGVSEAGDAPAATPGRCRVAGPGPVGSVRADEELGQEGHQQGVQADLLLLRQKGGVLPGRLSSRMRAAVPGSVCMRSAAWLNCSTTRTTPPRPVPCTPTCDGATPTPATPTSSPPNAANAPASAARKASAGADAPSSPLHNPQPGEVTRSPH